MNPSTTASHSSDEIEGSVQGHRDGHGYVIRDDGQTDIFLPPNEMRAVLHKDRVRARIVRQDRRGRPEGRVVEIIERPPQPIIGRLLQESGVWIVAPEDKRYGQDILIPGGALALAKPGQVVVVELTEPPALFDLGLAVQPGEMVALIGASGSGKSTLLRHLAGLACCDSSAGGRIEVLGREVQATGRLHGEVRRLRADIGYIFQQFNLVTRLSVLDNVLLGFLGRMPRWRGSLGMFSDEQKRQALAALERVGLADRAAQRASTLSGGQQQRVAIARALTQQAEVILADEPIASLDPESARKVMEILADINRQDGKTVVVTLHQVDYALRYCSRAVALKGGRIHYDGPSAALSDRLLNDLYGADLDASLLFSDRARNAEPRPLQLVNG